VQFKTHLGDLKDDMVMIPFTYYCEMTHVFHTLDLAVTKPIQQGLSPTNAFSHLDTVTIFLLLLIPKGRREPKRLFADLDRVF
jgi:hypothetical protein